jgi:lipid-binding SYLF domain-containing protein
VTEIRALRKERQRRQIIDVMLVGLLMITVAIGGCAGMSETPQRTGSGGSAGSGSTDAAAKIDMAVDHALPKLFVAVPKAHELAARARGILVFPNIVKAGLLVGGQYGEGALREHGKTVGYYNTVAASFGLQAGAQEFGYALFFMSDAALTYLKNSDGWEIGTGPSIVVLDTGEAAALTTTTARDDVYAVFFDQKGLMAGLGLQGSKITRINP